MPISREEILRLWDEVTVQINDFFQAMQSSRFRETVVSFGRYEMPVYGSIMYWIDNEVHHRGQAYVYCFCKRFDKQVHFAKLCLLLWILCG